MTTTIRKSLPLILAIALFGQGGDLRAEDVRRAALTGRVLGESSPLAAAHIYAFHLADLKIREKAQTDTRGHFLIQDLPAGLYKVIAHKKGFAPAIAMLMLSRTTAQASQILDFQLLQRQPGKDADEDDFWSIRSRIPADVLREIENDEAGAQLSEQFLPPPVPSLLAHNLETEMQALTGSDKSLLSGGIRGQVGEAEVTLGGQWNRLGGSTTVRPGAGPVNTGQTNSLYLDVARGPGSLRISSLNNRMMLSESGDSPVDFESYQVNGSQEVGANGRVDIAAHYTAENNFYRGGLIEPLSIPETSRTWRIEGAYTASLSDRNTLQTGLRYRERQFGIGPDLPGKAYERQALSTVDLFSRGGVRVQPAVLVEYGLYSTLSDGSLEHTPQGGLVFQLGSNWQLKTSAARRVYTNTPSLPDFLPTLFQQQDLCEQGSEACYQLDLMHTDADENTFMVGAAHRVVGDTLRLFFSEDFFDRLYSLYLVRGDEIPEVRAGFRRKISPSVVTSLDASVAQGGGGKFIAPTGEPYENQVRYLVTSLDTQLLKTSTGIFVAFHQLQQRLDPAADLNKSQRRLTATEMQYDRLELMLSQNLDFLFDVTSDWIVQLNMELTRGGAFTPADSGLENDKVSRRFLGGIAIKF
jgi:hypothetical protein